MTLETLIAGVTASRAKFWRHVDGLTDSQFLWKPYPECKSVQETLLHLRLVDRTALESIRDNHYDWDGVEAALAQELGALSRDELIAAVKAGHAVLLDHLRTAYATAPLDTPIPLWNHPTPLGEAVAYLSSEDYYHAGQVAFIRQATDPSWEYYSAIFGGN